MKPLAAFCLFVGWTITSFASTPQFAARQDIPTGLRQASGFATADFNGDGKPDFAVTDPYAQTVVVFLNKGDGTFSAPITTNVQMTAIGSGPIVAGDFNEDGKQDLILGTIAGNQADIYLSGNGDGTFTQQSILPGSYGIISGAAVDINNDRHLDFIGGGNGSLYVYLGDGRGGFQQQTFSNMGSPGAFFGTLATDLNNDHKVDFITASPVQTAGVRVYLGNGDGSFTAPTYLTSQNLTTSTSLATADFNGDGKQDLLAGIASIPLLFYGSGDGTFDLTHPNYFTVKNPTVFNTVPQVIAADIDGDGKPDAVVADDGSQTLYVYINDGSGRFTAAAFTAPIDLGTSNLATADFNGDGLPDIIIENYKTQNVSVFLSVRPKTAVNATLTSSANPQIVGSSVTLTAKVSPTGTAIPTGTVTLLDGTNSLGQQALDANGQATFSISNLSAGQHSLTISYPGDKNSLSATSATLTQSVSDFQIAIPASSQTVTAGGTASYSLTVTPTALSGSISITCSQLPSLSTCDPVSIPINGSQPVTATLAIHTTATVVSRSHSAVRTAGISLISAIALIVLFPLRRRKPLLFAIATFLYAGSIIGCSGGSSSSNPTTTPGTPQGTSTFTITSSVTIGGQTLTRTNTATLIVQ